MNTRSDKEMINEFINAIKPKNEEEKLQFEAEKIHLDFIFLLKEYMEKNGMCRKQLAKKMDVSESYLSQLFTGEKIINLKSIAKLQDILDVKFKIAPAEELIRYKKTYTKFNININLKPNKTLAA